MRDTLWYCFQGSKGADTRRKIVEILRRRQVNANQLKVELDVDYSTIRHSIRVLEKGRIVKNDGNSYSKMFSLTDEFLANIHEYDALIMCDSTQSCTKKRWHRIVNDLQFGAWRPGI